ncbi:Replication protein A 70 kDa DNA-binding subunit [Triticum urartu]|uniref:Replication protein A subunit n=1 Tax=Triticum urartu TaxID=4572 RepID=M7YSQ2_TRIUA|nr:Replication protein A 70 kDa DNA-binding subunit [Triticum urartu]
MDAKSVTPSAVALILSNPTPESPDDVPEIVVQVLDLKPIGSRFTFMASDGEAKVKAILSTHFASEVHSGKLQNLGLVRILNYTCNDIPQKTDKMVIITKCEVVSQALDAEIKSEVKIEEPPVLMKPKEEAAGLSKPIGAAPATIMLKPRHDVKSASQIVSEQRGNAAPAARLAMTRRGHPLISLNPYQGNWVIKGTQIQATMFNEAAKKFYPVFELGKVYYISKGSLRIANKQFKTVQNDYEMTLNETAVVEEAEGESFIPPVQYNFVKIDMLGPYVGGRELVDIIGVVQSVSPTLSIRRKIDNESIPKRDIVVADDSNKTVTISLWNDLATTVGEELLDMVDSAPIIAVKSLKVSDFQGVSVSTVGKSTLVINPELPEAEKLRAWYESEGKGTTLASVGAGMGASNAGGLRSMYSDRVFLSHITSDPNLGQDKPVFFSLYANISNIKPDQTMWYRACTTCNKKVTEALGSGFWCEGCQKNYEQCSLRYIMVIKVSDPTGEAWLSLFNDQAERIVGCSADELDRIRKEEGDDMFQLKLKEATWIPHLFRVSVVQNEYMGEKRQRITVRSESPVDYSAEARYQLEEIAKLTSS